MVENILEAMVDAVLVVDVEGKVVRANTAASILTGIARDSLRQLPVSQILVDDNSGLRTVVRQRIAEGELLRREESWLVHKSGTRVPVGVTAAPVHDDKGALQGIVLVIRDMRELHQLLAQREAEIGRRTVAEEELRAAKATIEQQLDDTRSQLVLAERRATLGTLAGGVGHELKNISQMAMMATEELTRVVATGGDLEASVREHLPDLQRVADHISTHGQRLLRLARPGPDRVEPLDLNMVVREVAAMLDGAGKTKLVTVVLELAPGPLNVTVNRTRIEQILINLVMNAVDALDKRQKKVVLSTRASDDGTLVTCEVRDNGSGIPVDARDKIFEPFFTTKPEDKGTGLGLPVARSIVESYGGTMTFDTVLGEGTTFKFTLPR